MRKNQAKFKQELYYDDDFRRWYENLQRGSEITADEHARVLIRYLNHFGMKPHDLVEKAIVNRKAVEDQLSDFITKKTKEGGKPGYLKNFVTVVRSYLKYHDIQLLRTIKLDKRNWGATDDRVPTQEEFKTLLRASDLRTQAIEILIAHSGVRPQVLGSYKGEDGLILKDISDLEIKDNKVIFKNMPAMIKVPSRLSKNGMNYHTFLSKEGCEILKNYIESRVLETQENLNPESPVITISKIGYDRMGKRKTNNNYGSHFIMTQNISREIRKAWKKITNKPPRPYVLRSYFDTKLMLAESQGNITHSYRQHFMGHKGDIEHIYTLNKKELPEDVIQDMRRSYMACEPYLTTESKRPLTEEDMNILLEEAERRGYETKLKILRENNFPEDRIREIESRVKSEEIDPHEALEILESEFLKITAQQLLLKNSEHYATNKNGKEHKIVLEKQLVKYLNEGWELVKEINGNKYLMKK